LHHPELIQSRPSDVYMTASHHTTIAVAVGHGLLGTEPLCALALLWSAGADARTLAGASISLRRSSKRVSPTENSVQLNLRCAAAAKKAERKTSPARAMSALSRAPINSDQ
jgi:hypothetical protein